MKIPFLNVAIDNLTETDALEKTRNLIAAQKKAFIAFVNVDVIVRAEKDGHLRKILKEADLTLTDGKPLLWISALYGSRIKEKISGSDFVPKLCDMAAGEGFRVFLLGGAEAVAKKAAANLQKTYPTLQIAGTYSPKLGFEKDENELSIIRDKVSKAQTDILIVCLGCPKQEKFIYENREKYDAALSVCAGATIDFLAGNVRRCPKWMSNVGLEWFFRFLMEPKRLFRRYFIDDMKVIALTIKYRPRRKKCEKA